VTVPDPERVRVLAEVIAGLGLPCLLDEVIAACEVRLPGCDDIEILGAIALLCDSVAAEWARRKGQVH
jgi:hypothetical protein